MTRTWMVGLGFLVVTTCQQQTPNAPASIPGKPVNWGQGFGTQAPAVPPTQMPHAVEGAERPSNVGAATGVDWSGGDPALGAELYANQCARCHALTGKGGDIPSVGVVPDLRRPEFHDQNGDAQIARVIAMGRGSMPAFMQTLDRDKLRALVAHVRTLKGRQ